MPKTDKELTAEIVIAFLSAWGGVNLTPPSQSELPNLIESVYKTVKELS